MYFPYLRTKQFELSALRDYIGYNHQSNKVIPILEPVKESFPQLVRTLSEFEQKEQPICLIVNPLVGALKRDSNHINPDLSSIVFNHRNVIPALLLNSQTRYPTISSFLETANNTCLVSLDTIRDFGDMSKLHDITNVKYHVFSNNINRHYRRDTARNGIIVLLHDCFPLESKNADYPDDSPLSDEIFFYSEEGRIGFSDYTILGNEYSESGGPAWAVTIHLTYEKRNQEIRVRHFTSDITNTNTDPGGKFMQALKKLIQWADQNSASVYESNGMREFRSLYEQEHYPGLGYLKKISILHHLELCNKIMHQ